MEKSNPEMELSSMEYYVDHALKQGAESSGIRFSFEIAKFLFEFVVRHQLGPKGPRNDQILRENFQKCYETL